MKKRTVLIVVALACIYIAALAQDAARLPVRVTISKDVHPLGSKMEITDTNTIARVVALFPGYEKKPQDKPVKGSWIVEYVVHFQFADGERREVVVADNKWKTHYVSDWTPLTTNWGSVVQQMTNTWSK